MRSLCELSAVLLMALSACDAPESRHPQVSSVTMDSLPLERGAVRLADSTLWETPLYEVRMLGLLPARNKTPFLILSGRGCTECDANLSIYVHSPTDGPLGGEHEQDRYPYPGTLTDPIEGEMVMRSRLFLGEVLPGTQGLLWLFHTRDESGSWGDATYLLTVQGDSLVSDALPVDTMIALEQVRADRARELPGLDQIAEP